MTWDYSFFPSEALETGHGALRLPILSVKKAGFLEERLHLLLILRALATEKGVEEHSAPAETSQAELILWSHDLLQMEAHSLRNPWLFEVFGRTLEFFFFTEMCCWSWIRILPRAWTISEWDCKHCTPWKRCEVYKLCRVEIPWKR